MSKQAFNNPVREGFRWERYQAGPATDRSGDGEGLVSRGGLVWLGEVADRSGLTAGLSLVLADVPRRRHDPGVGLAQLVVALADGAECLSDLDALRAQPRRAQDHPPPAPTRRRPHQLRLTRFG